MTQMVDKAGSPTEVSAQPSTPDDAMLVITRDFAAPIAVVWSALTDPDQAPAWWGPRGFHTPRETIETDI
jgi:uncharacterized protein YndB with AHSA1/START domain